MSLPKVGQTRCYWALLSSALDFIYLDPVLAHHLHHQHELLIGKSLLAFVHPDEQAKAQVDLGNVLQSRVLHGSVTRVRYSRLSRVRRLLGSLDPLPTWVDAEKIAVDENYMVVDIAINWAADGLVLCFIHAIVDLAPADNSPSPRSDWSNWCGTPWMPHDQIQLLFRRLVICVPPQKALNRVFQILSNVPERPLLLSWPPDSPPSSSSSSHIPSPTGADFAALAGGVNITGSVSDNIDGKTSCTRRYRSTEVIDGLKLRVESIFIPHGTCTLGVCLTLAYIFHSCFLPYSSTTTIQRGPYRHRHICLSQSRFSILS